MSGVLEFMMPPCKNIALLRKPPAGSLTTGDDKTLWGDCPKIEPKQKKYMIPLTGWGAKVIYRHWVTVFCRDIFWGNLNQLLWFLSYFWATKSCFELYVWATNLNSLEIIRFVRFSSCRFGLNFISCKNVVWARRYKPKHIYLKNLDTYFGN